jgi:uncharacterized protein (DUF58 family)
MNLPTRTWIPGPERIGADSRAHRAGWWSGFLWSLIYPTTNQRVMPTVSGWVLIGLAFGIGSAAYNAANNILFIALALLLSCLILSGVMSWVNLRGVSWLILVSRPLRAGQEAPVTLELRNCKSLVPAYGLWFDLLTRPVATGPRRPEATIRATSGQIRAAFTQLEKLTVRTTLLQRERLNPRGETRLDWTFVPARRGMVRVELTSVGSLFPFGFLRKSHGIALRRDVPVWPAPVEYRFVEVAATPHPAEGVRLAKAGSGNDLLALRRYQTGDSHRLIHWKASARLRRLMVRQFAAESTPGYFLRIDATPGIWPREEQFELMCGFSATLAEDLFTDGRIVGAVIDSGSVIEIHRAGDLETFLDRLAVLEWKPNQREPALAAKSDLGAGGADSAGINRAAPARRNIITFAPEGIRGVAAYVDGKITATA